jgi:hypothetical protein
VAQTMRSVFPSVFIIDSQRFTNSLVIATNQPASIDNFITNSAGLTSPLLQSAAHASMEFGNIREEQRAHVYFTDDRAPVEQLIDQMILNAVENGPQH